MRSTKSLSPLTLRSVLILSTLLLTVWRPARAVATDIDLVNNTEVTSTQVAFLELRNYRGDLILLEPRFPWAHMAISWQGGWLHAHPAKGVEWVSTEELERYGRIAYSATVDKKHRFDDDLAVSALGKPYDHQFSWSDRAYYCSELVAKILGIKPIPMVFDPTYWPPQYQHLNGLPGISPRLVFLKILEE